METPINKGAGALLVVIFLLTGCVAPRERMTIPDYVILPNGKEVVGSDGLNAFIFENNRYDITFRNFVTAKYKLGDSQEKDFWIPIEGDQYKILVYDNSELEKYFHVSDFIVMNQKPELTDSPLPKFTAISVISSHNDDCLTDQSLFKNIVIKYLKSLKEEFYKL